MIVLYRIIFLPLLLIMLPYYLKRMLKRGGYGKDFAHRLGKIKLPEKPNGTKRIWIQAVSVGELQAVAPIIQHFIQKENYEVVLTTTTSTAYKIALEQYANNSRVHTGLFPVDFWCFSVSAWKRIKPDLCILMESELWPEHIYQAKKRKVPIALINARISDRSFVRYRKVKFFAQRLFKRLNFIAASSESDAKRLKKLGANPDRVHVTGNLKFDVAINPLLSPTEQIKLRKELFGINEFQAEECLVLLGSSTWPGEEEILCSCYRQAKAAGTNCKLLIVPRHAERRKELKNALQKTELHFQFRSESRIASEEIDLYIGDTTGELKILSQIADIAFIGKSVPPNNGGQTPIECAILGIPIVYGPRMTNFRPLCRSLEEMQAAQKANSAIEVEQKISHLLADPDARKEMSFAARQWHKANQGATVRTVELLDTIL